MGKKRKKEKKKAPPEPAPESETDAPSPPWWKRRRVLAGGGASFIALAVFLLWASTLPGYESPMQEANRCRNHIQRIATAQVLRARDHGGEYAPDLRTLLAEGYLPGRESIYVCPASGKPYTVEPGIQADMPGSTVLIACPLEATHRMEMRSQDRDVVHLIHFIGADGRFQYEGRMEEVSPILSSETVRRAFGEQLQAQRFVREIIARLLGGEKKAAAELARFASAPRHPKGSFALALWGMGRSNLDAFLPPLRNEMARRRGAVSNEGLAAARALLRLGDDAGVDYLIQALGDANSSAHREAARDALVEAFHDADPPLPDTKPYAPDPFRSEDMRAVKEWWKAYRQK
ncbi:MAG: hypothetical protein ACYS47_01070 [Planctomycetota bacterium]